MFRIIKRLALVVLLLVGSSLLFAASLLMIPLSSSVYDDMEALYLLEGKSIPLSSKPWSEIDVKHMLSTLSLNSAETRVLADKIKKEADHSGGLTYNFTLEPKLMVHSNSKDFISSDYLANPYFFDTPLISAEIGLYYKEYFAFFTNASIGVVPTDLYSYANGSFNSDSSMMMVPYFTNIPTLPGRGNFFNFPSRAYMALGFDAFRFVVARDRLEWGNGLLGNITIGDTLPYHNYLTATYTGSSWFSYQLLFDLFSPFSVLEVADDRSADCTGLRFMLGHRFEFSLFKNKVTLSLSELIMYYSANNYIDLSIFNPAILLHNSFMAGFANSLAALELTYAPVKNLSLRLEFGLDDYALPNEPQPPSVGSTPDSIALALGFRYLYPIHQADFIYLNGEAVYTSPFMYHRGDGDGSFSTYDFYYLSSLRYFDGSGISGLIRYLSYPFGSDAIASKLSVGYKRLGLFDVSTSLFFMAHGIIDRFSKATWYGSGLGSDNLTSTPSTENPFDSSENQDGCIEYQLALALDGSYELYSFLTLGAGVNFVTAWNMNNVARPLCFDIQLTLSMKLSYGA